jgi:hypothetical protein
MKVICAAISRAPPEEPPGVGPAGCLPPGCWPAPSGGPQSRLPETKQTIARSAISRSVLRRPAPSTAAVPERGGTGRRPAPCWHGPGRAGRDIGGHLARRDIGGALTGQRGAGGKSGGWQAAPGATQPGGLASPEADGSVGGSWRFGVPAYDRRSTCSGSLNEFPIGSRPYASLEVASLHSLSPRGGTDDRSHKST